MVSQYGYITVQDLEDYAIYDYSARDKRYTKIVIEAQISQAERLVNDYKRQSYSGTIPDDVKTATLYISKKLMNNILIEDGYGREGEEIDMNLVDNFVREILTDSSKKYDFKLKTNVTSRFFTD